jgi:glutathione peroxidase
MNIYDFVVKDNFGKDVHLSTYKGKILLIINTASKCGFTSQYEGLQRLYEKYGGDYFQILAFPCNQFSNQEPGSDAEIKEFCSLNYGVTFPIFKKIHINGGKAEPLFNYLKDSSPGFLGKSIKWNFTKFLIDSKGNVIDRFSPTTEPEKLESKIEKLIKSN